ncbi:MAG: hypothetical protein AB7L90_22370 [Hyphomicrobiaceae bacterium]
MIMNKRSMTAVFASDGAIAGYVQKCPRGGLVTYDEHFSVTGGAASPKGARNATLLHAENTAHPQPAPRRSSVWMTRIQAVDYQHSAMQAGPTWR